MKRIISLSLILAGISLIAATPIKLNLEQGKTYVSRSISKQVLQQGMNGQSMEVNIEVSSVISYSLQAKETDGLVLNIKFDSITNISTSPMGTNKMEFAKIAKPNFYADRIRNVFCNYTFKVKVSETGKFISILNLKTLKEQVAYLIDSVSATRKEQVKKQSESLLKESNIQTMIEPFFNYLPEKPVEISEKWENTYVNNNEMMSLLVFNIYTLQNIEGSDANIEVKSEIETMPSNDDPTNGRKVVNELKGTSLGTMKLDINTGVILKYNSKGHIEGTSTVTSPNGQMVVTISADSESLIIKK